MPPSRASQASARIGAMLGLALLAALGWPADEARAQCLPAVPTSGSTVHCSGTIGEGFAVTPGTDEVTVFVDVGALLSSIRNGVEVNDASRIENHGTVDVNGIGSSGLAAGSGTGAGRSVVTNASDGTINVASDQAIGISASTRADVTNDGAIHVSGLRGTGVSIGSGASDAPSTVTNSATATITLDGDESVGVFTGANVTSTNLGSISGAGTNVTGIRATSQSVVDQSGTINLTGDTSRGIGAGAAAAVTNSGTITMTGVNAIGIAGQPGNGSSLGSRTRSSNTATGTITIAGDDSIAMSVGRLGAIENLGTLQLQGTGGIGLFSAEDGVSLNGGLIEVGGVDAVGIEADPFLTTLPPLFGTTYYNVWNGADPTTGAAGMIRATNPDAGPMIRLQALGTDRINRVRNDAGAEIRADLTNLGTAGRAIALEGSDGQDELVNAGLIQGLVQLGDGDDFYTPVAGGSVVELGPGQAEVDGGAGTDEIHLSGESTALGVFDIGTTQNFELLRVQGLWSLSAPTPMGIDVTVDPGGVFRVRDATRVESDLSFAAPASGQSAGALQPVVSAANGALPELLSVGGTATLDDGAMSVFVDNRFSGSATVTALRADTELVGRFTAVSLPADPQLSLDAVVYDDAANTVSVTVSALPFAPIQADTTGYLDRLTASAVSPELQSVIDGVNALDYTSYRQTLTQLHPEPYDAHTATTLELANRYVQLMLERPRYCVVRRGEKRRDPRTELPCREHRLEPWAAIYGQLGNRTGQNAHISYSDEGAGLVIGLDHRPTERLLLSGTIGGAYDSLEVDGIGKGRIKNVDLGLYAGYTRGRVRVQGVVSYGHGWHTRFRNLTLPTLARTAEAAWDTNRIGTRLEAEYALALGGWDVVPLASIDYTAMLQDGFTETGARPVSLVVDERTDNVVTLRAGFELTTALHKRDYWTDMLENADGVWRPSLSVRWRQVVTGYDRSIAAHYVDDATNAAGSLVIVGDAPNEGFEIGAGIDWTPRRADRLTFGLRYDVFVWTDVTSHDLVARVRVGF